VSRLSECSSSLLFVQVGHGVVTVYIYGRSRKNLREHSVVGAGSFIIRCADALWLTCRSA